MFILLGAFVDSILWLGLQIPMDVPFVARLNRVLLMDGFPWSGSYMVVGMDDVADRDGWISVDAGFFFILLAISLDIFLWLG